MKYINSLTTRSETFKSSENWLPLDYLLRSHYRNYGEHKGLAVLNSELSKLSL